MKIFIIVKKLFKQFMTFKIKKILKIKYIKPLLFIHSSLELVTSNYWFLMTKVKTVLPICTAALSTLTGYFSVRSINVPNLLSLSKIKNFPSSNFKCA